MKHATNINRRIIVAAGLALALGAGVVGVVHAQLTCGPFEVIVDNGGTLECREIDPSIEPDCPPGRYYDRTSDTCKVEVRIDCGPNPYRYNAVGGHWERPFNRWCYYTTNDPNERAYHDLTYGDVLNGAPAQQAATTTDGVTTGVTTAPSGQGGAQKGTTGKRGAVDCGQNPYNWNAFNGGFERSFWAGCEGFTGDPNESLYDGLTLDQTPLAG
jgi:hypothetical protein